ncbi:hypothetical protein DQK91_19745 [Oceanidesulfovibrio marinus]|uniref:Uncharacterized protein n=1 Tax=Oceanidesulfovibrio marinus TaxID=370038 RepID=A0A6P1ZAN4_9BACT|nr:hypothetical protein DQK91_19745 [Oceanidesulfovibrio marinus]
MQVKLTSLAVFLEEERGQPLQAQEGGAGWSGNVVWVDELLAERAVVGERTSCAHQYFEFKPLASRIQALFYS